MRYAGRVPSSVTLVTSWKQTPAPIRITFWGALVIGIAAIALAVLLLVAWSNFNPLQ